VVEGRREAASSGAISGPHFPSTTGYAGGPPPHACGAGRMAAPLMQVDFYHLTARPIEAVLPRIAERVLETGGRLLVVSADEAQRDRIDAALWTYEPESFLPHGKADGGGEANQPVLIAETATPANGAANIALADGEWRDEALAFARAFHFFDDASIVAARAAWRGLAAREGVEPRYWKQDERGRWSRVA